MADGESQTPECREPAKGRHSSTTTMSSPTFDHANLFNSTQDRSPAQPNTWHTTASRMMKASPTAIHGHAYNRKSHLCDELTHSPYHCAQNMQLVHVLSALRATSAPEKCISQYKSARVDTVAHPSPPVTCATRHTSQYDHCGQPDADTHPLCGLWRSCVGPLCGKMHIIGL